MTQIIDDIWRFQSSGEAKAVLPDGCRDLIFSSAQMSKWFVSDLYEGLHVSQSQSGTQMFGVRFNPGVEIDEQFLCDRVSQYGVDDVAKIRDVVLDHAHVCQDVTDAIICLSELNVSIARSARLLGVSTRSFQRILSTKTGKSPVFWRQLSRVRQAGRQLYANDNMAEFAFEAGFSDQGHMVREFRRWFGVTPTQFLTQPDLRAQLHGGAYI